MNVISLLLMSLSLLLNSSLIRHDQAIIEALLIFFSGFLDPVSYNDSDLCVAVIFFCTKKYDYRNLYVKFETVTVMVMKE